MTLALAVASAKTYRVTLIEQALPGGPELRPGDYKVEVTGGKRDKDAANAETYYRKAANANHLADLQYAMVRRLAKRAAGS